MFCQECGAELSDNAVVCPKCGVPVAGKAFAQNANLPQIPNHLVGAILTAIFCCQIGGIIAIIYAVRVNSKLAQGDIKGAQHASDVANGWIIANIITGILGGLVYFFLAIAGSCFSA